MDTKNTGSLLQDLMEQSNLDTYLKENQEHFIKTSIPELLEQIYSTKSISKSALAKRSGISEVYLHQVFSGRRTPSRDRLLCICIGMGATLEETQQLLLQAGYRQLYPRNKRDAIIAHGLLYRTDLDRLNESLFVENEKTLY